MNLGSLTLGALDGLLIGLLAVGLVLVFRSSRFLNLAHGQLGAMPALLLAKLVVDKGWPYWPSLIGCLAIGAITGVLVERFLVAKLMRKTKSAVSALLLTVGVTQLLLFLLFIPALKPDGVELSRQGYPLPFRGSFVIDGVTFGGQYVAILVFCPLLVAALAAFLRYSLFGKMIRATAANRDAARLCGISPKLVAGIAWDIPLLRSVVGVGPVVPGAGSRGVRGLRVDAVGVRRRVDDRDGQPVHAVRDVKWGYGPAGRLRTDPDRGPAAGSIDRGGVLGERRGGGRSAAGARARGGTAAPLGATAPSLADHGCSVRGSGRAVAATSEW
jgi:hypothetical protein